MLVFHDSEKQISPCIASKARYALNPNGKKTKNKKKCSTQYWRRVIETLCINNNINDEDVKQLAINRFDELIKQLDTMARINKKYFVLYNNGGVISATTLKNWARVHQDFFPNFNFIDADNTPTVETIELHLDQHNFTKIENKEIVIMYNYLSL